jgi:hypothetical protein
MRMTTLGGTDFQDQNAQEPAAPSGRHSSQRLTDYADYAEAGDRADEPPALSPASYMRVSQKLPTAVDGVQDW